VEPRSGRPGSQLCTTYDDGHECPWAPRGNWSFASVSCLIANPNGLNTLVFLFHLTPSDARFATLGGRRGQAGAAPRHEQGRAVGHVVPGRVGGAGLTITLQLLPSYNVLAIKKQ
jgi:hypothetical protein